MFVAVYCPFQVHVVSSGGGRGGNVGVFCGHRMQVQTYSEQSLSETIPVGRRTGNGGTVSDTLKLIKTPEVIHKI